MDRTAPPREADEPLALESPEAARAFVGAELGPSAWLVVDQARIDAFADATGDRQWIHCDVERARRESPWKSTIAHGYLSLSLVPVLLASLVELRGCASVVNTGLDKLRLSAPVPAGSRVRLHARIEDLRPLAGGGARIAFAVRLEVEGNAKPALLARVNYAYLAAGAA
jgi:acyl dehydratase